MPSSACSVAHPHLHSFPTRRSSDLWKSLAIHLRSIRRRNCWRWPLNASGRFTCLPESKPARGIVVRDAIHERHEPGRGTTDPKTSARSEEHTSELQSRFDLVCRLLLAPSPTLTYTLSLHDALPISGNRSPSICDQSDAAIAGAGH